MKSRKTILLAIAIASFVVLGMSGGLLNIAWTYMQQTFGVDVSLVGVLLLFGTIGALIASFVSGTLIARLGLGWATLIGVLLMIAGLLGLATSPVWFMLLLVFLIFGLGRGTLDAGMNNFVSENYGSSAMNGLHASWGLGLTLAPGYMAFIIVRSDLSWRWGYAGLAVLGGVVFVLVLWQLRWWDNLADGDSPTTAQSSAPVARASAMESIRQPAVIWSMVLVFVYGGVEIGTGQLMNTLLVESRGIPQETAASWIGFYWGSFTVGRLLMSVVLMRVSDRTVLAASVVLAVVGGGGLLFRESGVLNLGGLVLLGLSLAPFFPILISQAPRRVGRAYAANAIGFQVGFGGLGGAIIPGVIGYLTSVFGLEAIAFGLFVNTLLLLVLYRWVAAAYSVKPLVMEPSA
ncbi:MAG: MFS transporter [Chloroflexota bacterium]